MPDHIEIWAAGVAEVVPLLADHVTIGTDTSNDIHLEDNSISGLHAVLQRFGDHWTIRDVGSRNGTSVNGERIASDRVLRADDEIRVGRVRLVFRAPVAAPRATEALADPPKLTVRERDVLLELCRPILAGDAFTEASSVRAIARALVVSDAAVKQHLGNLYDKFGLVERDERRRSRLANAALTSGAIGRSDLSG